MNFGSDEPEAFTTANDLAVEVKDYLKFIEPYNHESSWSKHDFANYYDNGLHKYPFDTVIDSFPRYDEEKWHKAIKLHTSIATTFKTFIEQLQEYDLDDEDITLDDRQAHYETFESLITDWMCHCGLTGMYFLTQRFKDEPTWTNHKELKEKFCTMLFNSHQLSIQAAVILTQRIGYVGNQFISWVLCNLIIFIGHQPRYQSPYYAEEYPYNSSTVLFQDRTLDTNNTFIDVTMEKLDETYQMKNVPTIITNTIYTIPFQSWFQLISTNIRFMLLFTRAGGIAYVYHTIRDLFKNLQYVTENNGDKDTLTLLRKELFSLCDMILPYIELVINTICHPYQPTWILIGQTLGLILWVLSYCGVTEIKANGPTAGGYDFEQYATRCAKIHVWLVYVMRNSTSPDSFMRGYKANFIDPGYEMIQRNVVLHTKGKEIIEKEVFPILHEHATSPSIDWEPVAMSKVKPSPAFICKFPEWEKFPELKTLQIWNDNGLIRDTFDIKVKQYDNAHKSAPNNNDSREYDDVVSVFSDDDLHKRPTLYQYIQTEPKRAVDVDNVYGRIKFVDTGSDWDFRVKMVHTAPDLIVKCVSVDSLAKKKGKWRIITAGVPDFTLKLVKTGTADFTFKYD